MNANAHRLYVFYKLQPIISIKKANQQDVANIISTISVGIINLMRSILD